MCPIVLLQINLYLPNQFPPIPCTNQFLSWLQVILLSPHWRWFSNTRLSKTSHLSKSRTCPISRDSHCSPPIFYSVQYILLLSVKAFITLYILKVVCGKVLILTVAFHPCSLLPHLDKFSNASRMFPSPFWLLLCFFLSSLDEKRFLGFWMTALFSSISSLFLWCSLLSLWLLIPPLWK